MCYLRYNTTTFVDNPEERLNPTNLPGFMASFGLTHAMPSEPPGRKGASPTCTSALLVHCCTTAVQQYIAKAPLCIMGCLFTPHEKGREACLRKFSHLVPEPTWARPPKHAPCHNLSCFEALCSQDDESPEVPLLRRLLAYSPAHGPDVRMATACGRERDQGAVCPAAPMTQGSQGVSILLTHFLSPDHARTHEACTDGIRVQHTRFLKVFCAVCALHSFLYVSV